MAEARLDQIVKGAPTPNSKMAALASRDPPPLPHMNEKSTNSATEKYTPASATDPLANLPSSPPQIYLNLLILECSLRSQYLVLRARRRLHTFFLLLLLLWNSLFTYLLFLKPREDGSGIGGSVYWFVEMMEKVALMGGVLTGLLIWGTGQWERGVRWPRRWLHIANRGLRTMNTKIVVVKGKWWREGLGHMSFLFPLESLIGQSPGSEWHYVEHSTHAQTGKHQGDEESGHIVEEDLAPGGDHIKLLLLPKHFSPEFRENWEEYRTDYWEKENERRTLLRQRLKSKKRQKAKQHGGWLWWTGLWRMKNPPRPAPTTTSTTRHTHDSERHGSSRSSMVFSEKDAQKSQRRRSLLRSDSSHSRTSSRSSTPTFPDGDEKNPSEESGRPTSTRIRRGSNTGSAGRRKLSKTHSGLGKVSPLTRSANAFGEETDRGSAGGSRPSTPGSEIG